MGSGAVEMARGNILLIDDEETVRDFLRDFFEELDFNVEIASDGLEGIEKFQQGNFDLVLCDLLMPKMIGLEVLKRMKALKPDQRIIILTSIKEDTIMNKARQLGCHFYLNKPIRLTELEDKVSKCLSA